MDTFKSLHGFTFVSMARKRKYKMVRIPEAEYDELVHAKRELMRKGLDSLPEDLYEDQDEESDDDEDEEDGNFTMGLLVGLGAAALVYLLTKNKQQGGTIR